MFAGLHSFFDVVEYLFRIFGSRVVVGDDHDVSARFGSMSHLRALAAIAIASASKDENQASSNKWTYRSEGSLDCVGSVRVISEHRRIVRDDLEPAGNLRQMSQTVSNLLQGQS